MVGLRITAKKSVSLADMQQAIEESAVEGFVNSCCPEGKRYEGDTGANALTFVGRLRKATKRPNATNWRASQEVVDHAWRRQDAINVALRARKKNPKAAEGWVDESLRRYREMNPQYVVVFEARNE